MRIISGKFKSRKLLTPKGESVRPTTDRARETIFNILENKVKFSEICCFDLFCGTGSFGLECISRGGVSVFVDKKTKIVNANIKTLSVEKESTVFNLDVIKFVNEFEFTEISANKNIIIFADPPYNYKFYEKLIISISKINCLFVLEHSNSFVTDSILKERQVLFKKLGISEFSFYNFKYSK